MQMSRAARADERDLRLPGPVVTTRSRRGRLAVSRPTIEVFGQVKKLGSGRIVPRQATGQSQANGGSLTQIRCIHRTYSLGTTVQD
jgi:hypothetical protein